MFIRGNVERIIKIDYTLQLDSMGTNQDIKIYFTLLLHCLARKVVPQFTNYCVFVPFIASVLSPTRITAYAIR